MNQFRITKTWTFEIQNPQGGLVWVRCHGQWNTQIEAANAALKWVNQQVKNREWFPPIRVVGIDGFDYEENQ